MIKKIKEQLEFYYNNSDKASIEVLLSLQDKLSVNSYYLAEIYANCYKEYIDNTTQYRTKRVKTFIQKKAEKIEDKNLTDKLAEKYAEDETLAEYTKTLFKEAELEQYKVLLRQINQILSAIQQRISYLKKEKDITNN